MANTGKCPSCEKIIQKVKVEELNISDGLQKIGSIQLWVMENFLPKYTAGE